MRWRCCFIFLAATLLVQCKEDDAKANSGKKEKIVMVRDTTITPKNAFTTLFLDSLTLDGYIKGHGLDSNTAWKMHNFYKSRNYQYAWFTADGLAEQAQAFWNLHEQYVNYAKDNEELNKNLHRQMTALLEPNGAAKTPKDSLLQTELVLTEHFFDFANYAYTGSIDPEEMQWNIPRKKVDAVALLDSLVRTKGKKLEDWEPVNKQYRGLKDQLVHYYNLQKNHQFTPISMGLKKSLKKGDKDPAIARIKKRLKALGDLTAMDSSNIYDDTLELAVMHFQERHGLKPDGAIGKGTLQHMNVPLEKRIEQLLINMERMRWMPETPEGRRIIVNIPSYRMLVYEGDSIAMDFNIIVGKEGSSTVIFSDELEYVVFSPYWNVTPSITRNEIVPAMRRNPNYLSRQNMEITGYSNGIPIVRQKPGGGNALGKVKFIFPNRYNIYFHDTPTKGLFSSERRAFSHGCIRVSQPFELAKYLLKDKPEWTDEKITEYMNMTKETWAKLDKPIPVFLSYFTAWVDDNGVLNFREDIYKHDEKMALRMFKHEAH